MRSRSRKLLALLLCSLFLFLLFPLTATADMGPKPSVRVRFESMGDALCYGTLLSKSSSTGPYSVHDGDETHLETYGLDPEIFRALARYEDADGYHFLGITWKVSESGEISWTYYPPSSFKILLYYPESGRFAVSGIYERYAFDTYYTVDMEGVEIGSVEYDESLSGNDRLNAYRSYQYRDELLSLLARIVITILIEMGISLLFGFRGARALLLLSSVNLVTQILLNVALNLINFYSGELAFVVCYVLLELLIFVIEAILYCRWMNRLCERQRGKWFYIEYALVANMASFAAGALVVQFLPGIL